MKLRKDHATPAGVQIRCRAGGHGRSFTNLQCTLQAAKRGLQVGMRRKGAAMILEIKFPLIGGQQIAAFGEA